VPLGYALATALGFVGEVFIHRKGAKTAKKKLCILCASAVKTKKGAPFAPRPSPFVLRPSSF